MRADILQIRIGWDTAHYSESAYLYWGGDTAHNTTYYSESGGGTPHKIKVGCWLAGWFNDYSANPGSILQAETKILS